MSTATEDFQFLQSFLFERSAIVLAEEKEYLVESRLRPVAQRSGVGSIGDLVRALRRGDLAAETAVVDAMTTNETSWFRDAAPFECLRTKVLPELIEANRSRLQLSVWSAACSTGQELYSVAMVLDAEFPEVEGWRLQLLGTDLSTAVVERARAGAFSSLEINRGLPASHLVRYFSREEAHFLVNAELRSRVRFELMNLARPWPVLPTFDLVLLRNVLIYFDVPTRQRVLERVRSQLRLGGYLLLGTAESTRGLAEGFSTLICKGTTVFRREEK